jgi:hypothetical protein
MALACMAVMLLTASNFNNVILVIILAGLRSKKPASNMHGVYRCVYGENFAAKQ